MSLADIRVKYGATEIRGDGTAAVTSQILVPAVGDARIVVDYLVLVQAATSATTGTMVLESFGGSVTSIGPKFHFNGHSAAMLDTPYIRTKKGEALALTTTGALAFSYYIIYHTVGGTAN